MKIVIDLPEVIYMAILSIKYMNLGRCNQKTIIFNAISAIKNGTLVQEPFMNKPCVAHQVCHEDKIKVLEKIQADIEDARAFQRSMEEYGIAAGLREASEIINKYKSEEDPYDAQE